MMQRGVRRKRQGAPTVDSEDIRPSPEKSRSKAEPFRIITFRVTVVLALLALMLSTTIYQHYFLNLSNLHEAVPPPPPASRAAQARPLGDAPNDNSNQQQQQRQEEQNQQTAVTNDRTTRVECQLSTPASSSQNAANGMLRITVLPDLPSSTAFLQLVDEEFYSGAYLFRVVKNFVVQWGFQPGKPKRQPNRPEDTASPLSNIRGTLTMVKGSPQVFLNMGNNARLDKEGTLPFATVDEESMNAADKVYTGYKQGQGQIPAIRNGQVSQQFPEMSKIEYCRVVKINQTE